MKSKRFKFSRYVKDFYKTELVKLVWQFTFTNQLFPFYIRQHVYNNLVLFSPVWKIRKVCKLTARSRYVYSFFCLSRAALRESSAGGYNFALIKR